MKAHLTDCYYKEEQAKIGFFPNKLVNPKECVKNGKVTLKARPCYLMSNGNEITYNLKNDKSGVNYYDIDWDNNRILKGFRC